MANENQQSDSMKTVVSDKSRKAVKAESAMKAQAWVSGINTMNLDTSSSGHTGSTHQLLQSQMTTSLYPDGAPCVEPSSHAVVRRMMPSLIQSSVAQTASASLLPPSLSPDDTVVERTVVENILNPLHSSTVMADSASNGITLGTPMKCVDSISASAGHLKTSVADAQSKTNPSNTCRLHYEHYSREGMQSNEYVHNDHYTKQFDSNFGLLPQVQSITDHHSNEAANLHRTSPSSFRNLQPQTAVIENSAIDHENIRTSMLYTSPMPVLTVSSQSSAAQHVVTSAIDASHISSLQASHKNTKLNELWYRFSQDHTVCSPHAADSASRVEWMESGVVDSDIQQSTYQCPELQDIKMAENQWRQSSNSKLISSNSPGHSSLPLGSTTAHLNSSFDSGRVLQHRTELLHSSHSIEDEPKSAKPSKTNDAGKVSLFSGSVPVKHAWIVRDEALPVVPEDMTLDSVTSDFTSTSSIDDMGNIVTHMTKRHLPNDPRLLRLQQKIAQQREKHQKVRKNEQRRKEHIVKMELALRERQKAMEQKTADVKKTEGGRHPSRNQLEMSMSSATLTTVTSNDSDVTLISTSLQPDDYHSTDNSQLLSASDTSGSCTCQQARCEVQRVPVAKAKDVSLQKRHKSDTTFKPKLSEVKYTKSKVTKSAPVLSHETSSRVPERSASAKNVGRKVSTSSAAHRTQIPKSEILKNAQGDRRSLSKTNKTAAKAVLSKTNSTNRILTERNKQVTAEFGMQSKAVQTTPRLKDNQVLYANTAVQCPAISSHFDDLGVISLPVMSRGQHVSSLSSKIFSPDSSSDAEILQHLKHNSLMKQSVKASVPRELLIIASETNIYLFISR